MLWELGRSTSGSTPTNSSPFHSIPDRIDILLAHKALERSLKQSREGQSATISWWSLDGPQISMLLANASGSAGA